MQVIFYSNLSLCLFYLLYPPYMLYLFTYIINGKGLKMNPHGTPHLVVSHCDLADKTADYSVAYI